MGMSIKDLLLTTVKAENLGKEVTQGKCNNSLVIRVAKDKDLFARIVAKFRGLGSISVVCADALTNSISVIYDNCKYNLSVHERGRNTIISITDHHFV